MEKIDMKTFGVIKENDSLEGIQYYDSNTALKELAEKLNEIVDWVNAHGLIENKKQYEDQLAQNQ